jgi:predicted nucleic acid-binding protein
MTAFDTDILSDLFRGNPAVVSRVGQVPEAGQFIPVVVVDEMFSSFPRSAWERKYRRSASASP